MTYLALVWRQKSFALFAEPAAWQQAVDRANEWQKRALAARGREELTMAFEAFRAQVRGAGARAGASASGTRCRSAFHGALIAVGVAYSFWHIEELSPPLLKVTFMSAAPPPPPAAAAARGRRRDARRRRSRSSRRRSCSRSRRSSSRARSPRRKKPKEEPKAEDHGEKDGVKGGDHRRHARRHHRRHARRHHRRHARRHRRRRRPAAAEVPAAQHRRRAEAVGRRSRRFPPSLRRPGAIYHVLVKICVIATGTVDKVTIMKSTDSLLDDGVVRAVKTLALPPLHGERDRRSRSVTPGTFEFKTAVATARNTETDTHGLHTGRTLERDGPRRPRRSSLVLVAMSLYSLAITGDRLRTFWRGRKQSRLYIAALAPMVEGAGPPARGGRAGQALRGQPGRQRHRRRA